MKIHTLLIPIMFLLFSTDVSAVELLIDGEKTEVPVCGGFPGLKCEANQWCDYPPTGFCGIADEFGTCRPRPDNCVKIYKPVCGCDGETYGNVCEAQMGGVDIAHAGACGTEK